MKKLFFLIIGMASLSGAIAQNNNEFNPDLVSVIAKNADKQKDWYIDLLGFQFDRKMEFPQYDSLLIYFLKKGNFKLEIVQKKTVFSIDKFDPHYNSFNNPQLAGFHKLSFRITGINEWFQKMKEKKASFKTDLFDDKNFKLKSFIVEDAEGNLVQFVEYY